MNEEFPTPIPEKDIAAFVAKRRGRNLALLIALLLFAAIFYAVAMVKMGKLL
jgi:hypothetical protein